MTIKNKKGIVATPIDAASIHDEKEYIFGDHFKYKVTSVKTVKENLLVTLEQLI